MMREISERRGVIYSIPRTDNGIWHYAIHPKRSRWLTQSGPPMPCRHDGYASHDIAVAACLEAIDEWLGPVRVTRLSERTI